MLNQEGKAPKKKLFEKNQLHVKAHSRSSMSPGGIRQLQLRDRTITLRCGFKSQTEEGAVSERVMVDRSVVGQHSGEAGVFAKSHNLSFQDYYTVEWLITRTN